MDTKEFIRETKDVDLIDLNLKLGEDTELKTYQIPEETLILSRGENMIELPLKMKDLIRALHNNSLRESLNIFAEKKVKTEDIQTPLDEFLNNLIVEETMPFLRKLYDEKFLVSK